MPERNEGERGSWCLNSQHFLLREPEGTDFRNQRKFVLLRTKHFMHDLQLSINHCNRNLYQLSLIVRTVAPLPIESKKLRWPAAIEEKGFILLTVCGFLTPYVV